MFSSPAWKAEFARAIRFFFLFALTFAFGISPSFAGSQGTESPLPSIPILVSDFELFAVSAVATPATPTASPIATPPATPIASPPTGAIATPPATQIGSSPASPISTPPATPLSTPPASPISTPPATRIGTPPAPESATQSKQKPPSRPVDGDPNLPSVRARRLMDFFSETLLQILHEKGYNATRARGQNPSSGAILRGVFAEPDEKNRVRRSLLGGTSVNPRFLLYVGIFNLARPDQPLYQLAQEQPGGNQFGPVITLNNYIPLAKYELDKNPSDDDVRQICTQIAASLTALLAANPSAFAQ